MPGVFLWGWDSSTSKWVPVLVNAAGKLIIDPTEIFTDTPADSETDKAPTSNWAYDEATARAAADLLRLLLTGGTMSGDISLGTNKLKMQATLIKDDQWGTIWIRNLADTGNAGCIAAYIYASAYFILYGNNAYLAANDVDGHVGLFKARDTGVGLVEIARLVGAADPYFQATLPMVLKPIATASLPTTPVEGMIAYDATLDAFVVYNGVAWIGPFLPLAGGTMSGAIAMGGNKITGLAAPVNAGDALRKGTRVTVAELPALTDEKIWKGTGGDVEEVAISIFTLSASGQYTGDGASNNRAIAHGLGLTPKVIFIVRHDAIGCYEINGTIAVIYSLTANTFQAVTISDSTNFYVGKTTFQTETANANAIVYDWVAIG